MAFLGGLNNRIKVIKCKVYGFRDEVLVRWR